MDTDEKKFGTGVRWSLLGSGLGALIQLVQLLLFARFCGTEAMGTWALGAAIVTIGIGFADLGLGQALVQQKQLHRSDYYLLLKLVSGIGLGLAFALFVGAGALAAFFNNPSLKSLLELLSPVLLFGSWAALYTGVLLRNMRFEALTHIELYASLAGLLAFFLGIYLGLTVLAMGIALLVRFAVMSFAGFLFFKPNELEPGKQQSLVQLFQFGVFDMGTRWVELLAGYLDKLILGKLLGPAALGYYNIAYAFYTIPTSKIGFIVSRVAFPFFARIQEETLRVRELFQAVSAKLLLLLLPIYSGLILFAHEGVLLLLGEEWMPAGVLIQVLSLGGFMRSMSVLYPQAYRGLGMVKKLFWALLVWNAGQLLALYFVVKWIPEVHVAVWLRALWELLPGMGLLYVLSLDLPVQFNKQFRFAARLCLLLAPILLLGFLPGVLFDSIRIVLPFKIMLFATGMYFLIFRSGFSSGYRALWEDLRGGGSEIE